jgi:excisionase family DNA binding protein
MKQSAKIPMHDQGNPHSGHSNKNQGTRNTGLPSKDWGKGSVSMSDERRQSRTRSTPGAGLRKARARYTAQCRTFRRSIVALIRSWVRARIVANPNQVAAELNRRAVPQLKGEKGWQRNTVVEMLREEAPNLLAKLEHPRRHYLTVLELARKLGVDRKQIYYAVERGTLGCRRFGRKIVFPPDVIERAVRVLRNSQ